MPRRTVAVLVALSITTASCGQRAPERGALPPLPDEVAYPSTTSTTADPIPADGGCYLVESVGARVRSTQAGFDAANHLTGNDVIVAVDGDEVTSQETLVEALSRHLPGDAVTVTFEREGSVREASTTLGARPEDPAAPLLGVIVEPAIVAQTPADVARSDGDLGSRLLVIANDEVMALDPLRGEWRTIGVAAPEGPLVVFDGAPYTALPGAQPALVPLLATGRTVPLAASDELLLSALTATGTVVVVVVAVADVAREDGPPELSVAALDTATGSIAWRWEPRDAAGTVATPLLGYRSPDESHLVITSELDGSRIHTVFDAAGTPLAGWGTGRDLVPPDAAFMGWHDRDVAAFAVAGNAVVDLVGFDLSDFSFIELGRFLESDGLRQLWSVGDGRHIIAVSESESWLYDLNREARGRTLARACNTTVRDGPVS